MMAARLCALHKGNCIINCIFLTLFRVEQGFLWRACVGKAARLVWHTIKRDIHHRKEVLFRIDVQSIDKTSHMCQ